MNRSFGAVAYTVAISASAALFAVGPFLARRRLFGCSGRAGGARTIRGQRERRNAAVSQRGLPEQGSPV